METKKPKSNVKYHTSLTPPKTFNKVGLSSNVVQLSYQSAGLVKEIALNYLW